MTQPSVFRVRRLPEAQFQKQAQVFETLTAARAEAARILQRAETEAETQRAALQDELKATRLQAEDEAATEIDAFIAAEKDARMTAELSDLIALSRALKADFAASETWLTEVVLAAVQRILNGFPKDKLDLELIRSGIKDSGGRWNLELRVARADRDRIEALLRAGGQPFDCIESVVAQSDLEAGQMLLLSASGITDLSLDVQLDTLRAAIQAACSDAATGE